MQSIRQLTDFYHLGGVPPHLKELELGSLNSGMKPLKGKSLIIEVNKDNLNLLKHLSSDYFENCVFIYHFREPVSHLEWFDIFNQFKPLIYTNSELITIHKLELSLEELRRLDQQHSYKKMLEDSQAQALDGDKQELERLRVEDRKVDRSLKRVTQVNFEEELNLKALEVIFDAQSLADIEEQLLEILRDALGLKWLRILISPKESFQDLSILKHQKTYQIKTYNLDYDDRKKGAVIFAFEPERKVRISTGLLLQRLSDALSLRIKQLSVESEIETTSHQWETTFKALPFKVALVDKSYNVIQVGGEFNGLKTTNPCYKTFFNKDKPCQGCRLGESFLIDKKNESLEVNSKEIFDPVEDDYYYLNFYRDFEVSTLTESRKATKSKLEELGIISGSIAHELNNPLAGMKILLELLEDEKEISESHVSKDLKVLKKSIESCTHTVQELLSFTRMRRDTNPLEKTLEAYFNQLFTFTQAHLRSEGFVLEKTNSDFFTAIISSPDATLPIKLLESLSQFVKEQDRKEETQVIYFYPEMKDRDCLELNFSLVSPNSNLVSPDSSDSSDSSDFPDENEKIQKKGESMRIFSLGRLRTGFNSNKSRLTLQFLLGGQA